MRRSDSSRALAASFSSAPIFGSLAGAVEAAALAAASALASADVPSAADEEEGFSAAAFGSVFLAAGFAAAFPARVPCRGLAPEAPGPSWASAGAAARATAMARVMTVMRMQPLRPRRPDGWKKAPNLGRGAPVSRNAGQNAARDSIRIAPRATRARPGQFALRSKPPAGLFGSSVSAPGVERERRAMLSRPPQMACAAMYRSPRMNSSTPSQTTSILTSPPCRRPRPARPRNLSLDREPRESRKRDLCVRADRPTLSARRVPPERAPRDHPRRRRRFAAPALRRRRDRDLDAQPPGRPQRPLRGVARRAFGRARPHRGRSRGARRDPRRLSHDLLRRARPQGDAPPPRRRGPRPRLF